MRLAGQGPEKEVWGGRNFRCAGKWEKGKGGKQGWQFRGRGPLKR